MKGQNYKMEMFNRRRKKEVQKIGRGEKALKLNVRIYAKAAFKQGLVEI